MKRVLSIIILMSFGSSLLLFQNCARNDEGFETIAASKSSIEPETVTDVTLKLAALAVRPEFSCPDLLALKDTGRSAVVALQNCIDRASNESSILLPGGKYLLDAPVVVNKSITLATKNVAVTDVPCGSVDSGRCASFVLSAPPKASSVGGMIQVIANKVNFDHIVVDGDRANPVRQIYSLCRNNDTRGQGNNISLDGTDFVMMSSVIRNSPCSTGFEVHRSAVRFKFMNNFVGNNGAHNEDMMWADGLTIHSNADAVVDSNIFQNNTDVDLIFGGCQRCLIQNNKIIHNTSFAGSSFAALMLHSWDATHGDYTGSITRNNTVDCSYMRRCGFGILLGSEPWYDQPYFGGEVSNNTVKYAMAGLVVNDATGAVKLLNNVVSDSGGKFASSCGDRDYAAISISSGSVKYVNTNQTGVANVSYKGCIANWWNRDSVTPRCDPATQPAPHWGVKSGQCLKSCGGLGGTRASASSCSSLGMADAGTAYDVPFCCKPSPAPASICNPATQSAPHWGVKSGQCLKSCGGLGGTRASASSCSSLGMADAGVAYDVPYCCKPAPAPAPVSICNPSTQPAPHWGVKGGQCLKSCGALGGTRALNVACAGQGLKDVGVAYDVAYCCK